MKGLPHRPLRAVLFGVAALSGALAAPAQAQNPPTIEKIYETLKGFESLTRPPDTGGPRETGTVSVGTFNAARGQFTGLVSVIPPEPIDGVPPKVHRAVATIYARDISLVFGIQHRTEDFTVTATLDDNGRQPPRTISVSAPPGADSVTLDVGTAERVDWTVASGDASVSSVLWIDRTLVRGLGGFTISALPIAIVYEPPSGVARYSQTTTVSSKVTLSLVNESSQARPGAIPEPELRDLMTFKQIVSGLGVLLGAYPDPKSKAAGGALGQLAEQVGNANFVETTGGSDGHSTSGFVLKASTRGIESNTGLGPGHGDVLCVMRNARLAWVDFIDPLQNNKRRLVLTLIGGEVSPINADTLRGILDGREANTYGLSLGAIRDLLSLDPFVNGGEQVALPVPRFRLLERVVARGARYTREIKQTEGTDETYTGERYQMTVEEYQSGLLSAVGLGVNETKTLTSRVTQSQIHETHQEETTVASVVIDAPPDRYVQVGIYYDSLFGTLAVRSEPILPE